MNGLKLVDAIAGVHTLGTSNTLDVQIRRRRSSTDNDMLSTKITISAAEYYARDGVINATYQAIATGDRIFIDVDAIHGTPAKGLYVTLVFKKG
jgi:hypothetical protein